MRGAREFAYLRQRFYNIVDPQRMEELNMADAKQLDIDYTQTIANLTAKLKRQTAACQQTEQEIAGFKKLQELQKR